MRGGHEGCCGTARLARNKSPLPPTRNACSSACESAYTSGPMDFRPFSSCRGEQAAAAALLKSALSAVIAWLDFTYGVNESALHRAGREKRFGRASAGGTNCETSLQPNMTEPASAPSANRK